MDFHYSEMTLLIIDLQVPVDKISYLICSNLIGEDEENIIAKDKIDIVTFFINYSNNFVPWTSIKTV